MDGVNLKTYTASERVIQSKLSTQIDVNFKNVPLRQAIDDLAGDDGVTSCRSCGFSKKRRRLDKPVTLKDGTRPA